MLHLLGFCLQFPFPAVLAAATCSIFALRKAVGHIEAGAEKVIISAPGKGNLSLELQFKRSGGGLPAPRMIRTSTLSPC